LVFFDGLGMLSMYSGTAHPELRRTLAILSNQYEIFNVNHAEGRVVYEFRGGIRGKLG
jgi:hypothetical protein